MDQPRHSAAAPALGHLGHNQAERLLGQGVGEHDADGTSTTAAGMRPAAIRIDVTTASQVWVAAPET